ncbi:NUDIX hydrolase [Paenibacillus kobensis]|uniref:NUDIX hydrolase n=1 Tax=Paenibacillus kobensis TaxID=59841 RepID=UPI0024829135|nr:NUDIX domain-containing protein [Paenibacillus kobensis]
MSAAGCVITNGLGHVLLVKQTYDGNKWALPGGRIDPEETAWDAVVRECREEISLKVSGVRLTGMYYLPHRSAYYYVFRADAAEGKPTPDGDEIAECGFFDPERLPSPITSFTVQRIRDSIRGDRESGPVMAVQRREDRRLL